MRSTRSLSAGAYLPWTLCIVLLGLLVFVVVVPLVSDVPSRFPAFDECGECQRALAWIINDSVAVRGIAYNATVLHPLSDYQMKMNRYIYGDALAVFPPSSLVGCTVRVPLALRRVVASYSVNHRGTASTSPADWRGDPRSADVAVKLDILNGSAAGQSRVAYISRQEIAESAYARVEADLEPNAAYWLHGGAVELDRSVPGLWTAGTPQEYIIFACPFDGAVPSSRGR